MERGGNTLRIAICDDEQNDLLQLQDMVINYCLPTIPEISCFESASALFDTAKCIQYDLVLLDIEMESPNGYEIARKLIEQDHKPLIIFVTNSMAYTIRGYGVAFRYLTKPLDKGQLWEALDAAIKETAANRFIFAVDGNSHILTMDEIYYFEVFNHHTILHTVDTEYVFRATLKEVVAQLPLGYFGIPHQSYIVNFNHIKTATSKDIQLTNGSCIPVSRRKQKDFENQLHQYLGR